MPGVIPQGRYGTERPVAGRGVYLQPQGIRSTPSGSNPDCFTTGLDILPGILFVNSGALCSFTSLSAERERVAIAAQQTADGGAAG